ncbi:uncharacterized protein LOC127252317 isoform X2 [Andrographis paniculata]|uniref:uncharacterized protein LOC127252317 isoform X2 n=1 Tax=Andrographis paniculata TaxID=175694 RepID=UPI0021E7651D|nr:uncharacterized protein LOC127252317 isoform X2 [Andrographis paniculata]
MAVIFRATSSLTTVRSESTGTGNDSQTSKPPPAARPLLSLSKPTWIVRTEGGQIVWNWQCSQRESGRNGAGAVVGADSATAAGAKARENIDI